MNLDSGLIKQQARALIKDKVMKLFITSFVVSIAIVAIGGLSFSITSTSSNDIFNGSDYSFSDNGNSNDKNYFNDFDGSGNSASDFENFGTAAQSTPEKTLISAPQKAASSRLSVVSYPLAIARILLLPLLVSLSWYYVKFVNGREYELGAGIQITYKEAFENHILLQFIFYISADLRIPRAFAHAGNHAKQKNSKRPPQRAFRA